MTEFTAQQSLPLSHDEQEMFGWDRGPSAPNICWTRGPQGHRIIPTRQLLQDGSFFYGTIETWEAPPGISDEEWASSFGEFGDTDISVLQS